MTDSESADPDQHMADDPTATFLPLKKAWFHILVTLADGPQHGYAIGLDVEERTSGEVRLWPATLYGSLRDMSTEGLIEELDEPSDRGGDQRRRFHRLTALGRDVLRAEADRLQNLVDTARATRALS